MIGANKYNGQVHTFLAEQLINEVWNDLSKNDANDTPVTVGTDNWFVAANPLILKRKPFFNRVGFGGSADMTTFFYKNDRIYLNDLTIFCNFADGLVRQSDIDVTPVPFTPSVLPNALPLPEYEITRIMKIRITTYYMTATGILSAASLDLPVAHFNTVNNLGVFMPELPSAIVQTNICQWMEIQIIYDNDVASSPAYSTKSINTAFQSDRVLVWAEATLSHTFSTSDYDAVIAGQTGWPD